MFRRRRSSAGAEPVAAEPDEPDLIDVQQLLSRYTVGELAATAEEYFRRLPSWDSLLAKPLAGPEEAALLLADFGAALSGLELVPDQVVLDFGVGPGWTSWMLSQLGCRVIATDISQTALRITEERYRRLPPIANRHDPILLHFDGSRLPVDDASVERILCFDAFHHVPNPRIVLDEFARVLAPGGVCVLMEPGPQHSRFPQSQYEMRNFGVVERDIVIEDVASDARASGFSSVEVAVFAGIPSFVGVADFDAEIATGSEAPGRIMRTALVNRRLIRLRAPGEARLDSRTRHELSGAIDVQLVDGVVRGTVKNTGRARWIQENVPVGHVNLGAHLYDAHGALLDFDGPRFALRDDGAEILPGESVDIEAPLPPVPAGSARVEFDLVSEGVAWFSVAGGSTCTVELANR